MSSSPHDALLGVRWFRVCLTRDGWRLAARLTDVLWQPGDNTAVCVPPLGSARCGPGATPPAPGCGCGLWAFHDVTSARRRGGRLTTACLAAVAGWGDVLVYRDGWRSAHAKVLALARPSSRSAREKISALARDYHVPVVEPVALLDAVADHGRRARPSELP